MSTLELRGVSVSFDGAAIVDSFSAAVDRGE